MQCRRWTRGGQIALTQQTQAQQLRVSGGGDSQLVPLQPLGGRGRATDAHDLDGVTRRQPLCRWVEQLQKQKLWLYSGCAWVQRLWDEQLRGRSSSGEQLRRQELE